MLTKSIRAFVIAITLLAPTAGERSHAPPEWAEEFRGEYESILSRTRPVDRDLKDAEKRLDGISKARYGRGIKPSSGERTFRTLYEKNKAIDAAKKDVETARSLLANATRPIFEAPAIEDLDDVKRGRIMLLEASVTQVIDGSNAIVELSRTTSIKGANGQFQYFSDHKTMWLADFPTEGITDGQTISLPAVAIVGTKRYQTRAGSNTVMMAMPFNSAWMEAPATQPTTAPASR